MGFWSIVVPEASKNYVKNPSFEVDLTGWTATGSGGSRATSDSWQKRGILSLKHTHATGVAAYGSQYSVASADLADFIVGDSIAVSFDIYVVSATARVTVACSYTGGGGETEYTDFTTSTADGKTRATILVGPLTDTITALTIDVSTNTGAGAAEFYVDGIQLERKAYATTYFDGESYGCEWMSTPHNSKSTRDAALSSGGRDVNLDDLGYYVEEAQGLGMPSIELITQLQSLLPGSLLRGYTVKPRTFQIGVVTTSSSQEDLHDDRRTLINILKPDRMAEITPLTLRYSGANSVLETRVVYDSGMGFNPPNGFAENVVLRLYSPFPFWGSDGEQAFDLDTTQTISSLGQVAGKEDGDWKALGTGLATTGRAYVIKRGPDGLIYVGGNFTSAGGAANTRAFAVYNPETDTWSGLGGGQVASGGIVYGIDLDADGNVYIGGNFTDVNSVSNTAYLAKWNKATDTWVSITPSGSANGIIYDVMFRQYGGLVVTGAFTSINSGPSINRIAEWDMSSTWSAYGSGLNGDGYTLASAKNGDVYVGGVFTTAGGVTVNCIARFHREPPTYSPGLATTSWNALGSGVATATTLAVRKIIVASDGTVYLGGQFDTAGGVTVYSIASWNGSNYSPIGGGLRTSAATRGTVTDICEDSDGRIWVSGSFKERADGLQQFTLPLIFWNGSLWIQLDAALTTTADVDAHAVKDFENLWLSISTGNLECSEANDITYVGTAELPPKLILSRDGGTKAHIRWIENQTNNTVLWFDYKLQDGETLTIELVEGGKFVRSSIFGILWEAMLPTSNVSKFRLQTGVNHIKALVEQSGSPTVSSHIIANNRYWSGDGTE